MNLHFLQPEAYSFHFCCERAFTFVKITFFCILKTKKLTAAKTIIQNWFTPHMCRKTYWICSQYWIHIKILKTYWITNSVLWMCNGASRWGQAFDHWCLAMFSFWYTWLYGGVTFVVLPSLPLFWLDFEMLSMSVVLFCYILDVVLYCVKKKASPAQI